MNNPYIWVVGVLALGGVLGIGYLELTKTVIEVENSTMPVEVQEMANPHAHLLEDEDARAAAQAVIDRKRAEAELDAVQSEIEDLTATYKASLAKLEEKETALEKELGTY